VAGTAEVVRFGFVGASAVRPAVCSATVSRGVTAIIGAARGAVELALPIYADFAVTAAETGDADSIATHPAAVRSGIAKVMQILTETLGVADVALAGTADIAIASPAIGDANVGIGFATQARTTVLVACAAARIDVRTGARSIAADRPFRRAAVQRIGLSVDVLA